MAYSVLSRLLPSPAQRPCVQSCNSASQTEKETPGQNCRACSSRISYLQDNMHLHQIFLVRADNPVELFRRLRCNLQKLCVHQ